MFEQLPESRPARERSLPQLIGSALLHSLLIAVAVAATQAAASVAPARVAAAAAFIAPPPPPPIRVPPPPSSSDAAPVVRGFQALPQITLVPTTIPAADLTATFSRDDYTGLGAIGGRPDGLIGGAPSTAEVINAPTYESADVDEPAALLRGATPRYPNAMRLLGIGGSVSIEFVVTPDGQADSTSLRILSSTDPRFQEAARAVILASSYRPARFRGTPVRQLVRQLVTFTMEP